METNQLDKGKYSVPAGGTDIWNGTFKVLEEYTLSDCDNSTVVQGATYKDGYIYTGVGSKFEVWQIALDDDDHKASIKIKKQKYFNGDGTQLTSWSNNGIAFDSNGNLLLVGVSTSFSPQKLYCFPEFKF